MLYGGIQDWQKVYQEAFNHLATDGWFEQVEIDFTPRCDDGTLPSDSAFIQWANELTSAMNDIKRPLMIDWSETKAMMTTTGFVDIRHETIQANYNSWGNGRNEDTAGRWLCAGMTEALQGLTLAPLTRERKWPHERVNELVSLVQRQIRNQKYHCYCVVYVRKPPLAPKDSI